MPYWFYLSSAVVDTGIHDGYDALYLMTFGLLFNNTSTLWMYIAYYNLLMEVVLLFVFPED